MSDLEVQIAHVDVLIGEQLRFLDWLTPLAFTRPREELNLRLLRDIRNTLADARAERTKAVVVVPFPTAEESAA